MAGHYHADEDLVMGSAAWVALAVFAGLSLLVVIDFFLHHDWHDDCDEDDGQVDMWDQFSDDED